jgi:hypothetical protein
MTGSWKHVLPLPLRVCELESCRKPFAPYFKLVHTQKFCCKAHEKTAGWQRFNATNPERRKALNQETLKRRNEQLQFARQYPSDWWDDDKADWRPIGSELLSRMGYMSNEDLADRLNTARIVRCPFCEDGDWGCITRTGRAMNFIAKVRKWVNRPGGRAAMRK